MKIANIGFVTLIGLILAAAGIVAPITWDWYRSKSAIELHHTSNVKLVESSILSKKVQLTYDGKLTPILSRHTFSIINTGRTSILKKDLVQPPTITFPNGVEILEVIEDAKNPNDLEIQYVLDSNKNSVTLSFPLLNPGDQSQFGVLLSGFTSDYSVHARIVGIRSLTIVDSVAKLQEVKRKRPFSVYVVGFFALLLTLALIVGALPELIEENKIKAAVATNKFVVPLGKSGDDYLNFIRATFRNKTRSELKPIIELVRAIPPNTDVDLSTHEQISKKITEYAMKMNVIPVLLSVLVLSIIGWWYVIANVIN